jgi:hypothetical protein
LTFLARTARDGLLAATFNNTNTTDVVQLWYIPTNSRQVPTPRVILVEAAPPYKGFGGVDVAADGSVVATLDQGANGHGRLWKLRPDFLPDPSFGSNGVVELVGERALGVTVVQDRIHVVLAWGRLVTYCLRTGVLLAASSPDSGGENGMDSCGHLLATLEGKACDGAETTVSTPIIPPWVTPPSSPSDVLSIRYETQPRIRDLAGDPRTGLVFGVGADRVYVWLPSGNGERNSPMVGPCLLVDGTGPVLPAQGIMFVPNVPQLVFAVNAVGTLGQIVWPDGFGCAPKFSLFSQFQASSSSTRAVDSVLSSDGETLWVSDLSGSITEYGRRYRVVPESNANRALGGLDWRGSQRQHGGWDLVPVSANPASVTKDTLVCAEEILLRGAKPWQSENTPEPVALLILFRSEGHGPSDLALKELNSLAPRLPQDVFPATSDVRKNRELFLRLGIFVLPTVVITDIRGRELARLEGDLNDAGLSGLLQRAWQAYSDAANSRKNPLLPRAMQGATTAAPRP